MTSPSHAKGVYFLANNKIFDLAIAFLRSFRRHNPHIPLCLIPFDEHFDAIAALKDVYDFSIFDNQELLDCCDKIGQSFHGKVLGTYRKLVAWEGNFESFIYIDSDTVVTDSIDFAFDSLRHADYVGSHSNIANIRKWVWKDNVHDTHLLTPPQIDYATNTGFFVSVRGLFPIKYCLAKVNQALELRDSMELHCMEQPYLNYLVVSSGYRFTSLSVLRHSGLAPTMALEWWGGTPNARVSDGMLYSPMGDPIFLVHWAGIFQTLEHPSNKKLPYSELWEFYRRSNVEPEQRW